MENDGPGDGWLSTGTAAEKLGVSAETVRTYADTNRLIAKRTAYGRLISALDVERLRAEREARSLASTAAHGIDRDAALIRRAAKGLPADLANPLKEHTRAIQANLRKDGAMDSFKGIEHHIQEIDAMKQMYSGVFSQADRLRELTDPLRNMKDQLAILTNVQAVSGLANMQAGVGQMDQINALTKAAVDIANQQAGFAHAEQLNASTKAIADGFARDLNALTVKVQADSYAALHINDNATNGVAAWEAQQRKLMQALDPFGGAGHSITAMDQASRGFDIGRAVSRDAYDKLNGPGGMLDPANQVGELRFESPTGNQPLISPRRAKADPRIDEIMASQNEIIGAQQELREEMTAIKEMLNKLLDKKKGEAE